jgi:nicotinate-nucleotide adenylyltransferase
MGHVTMARAAVEQLSLDKLLVIPAGIPPHKQLPVGSANTRQRWEMAQLMAGAVGKCAEARDMEIHREGKSFTSDTLLALREEYADAEMWLLMGSDMFLSLHTWHTPEIVCREANIAAFSRNEEDERAAFEKQKAFLEQTFGARVAILDNPNLIEVSSTELRAGLPKDEGEELLPTAVWGYVQREQLYGADTDLKHLTVDELRPIALSYLKPKRVAHVLGTERTAAELARQYGVDETEARIAALLHDCTKKLELEEQLKLCEQYDIDMDEMERQTLKLQHSRTGAAIARHIFGVSDAVYDAIRYHTTGRPDMTLLEKIIYIADYIEPNRRFDGVEAVRDTTARSLDEGILLGLTMTIEEMKGYGTPIHHLTMDAREYLIQQGGVTI